MMKLAVFAFLFGAAVASLVPVDVIPHYSYHGLAGSGISSRYFRKAQPLGYGIAGLGYGYNTLGGLSYGLNSVGRLGYGYNSLNGLGYGVNNLGGLGYGYNNLGYGYSGLGLRNYGLGGLGYANFLL
ncbi:keratin-associated protein 16-3-like [Stegodyphus dumicola]|uniref:keratin-associated protein 16-3-like n=1 Tax=Stegodyphus dumicola TaxID=202533 RepID=UPI0015AD7B86|nr:keratin-associated protein 16-3-like [Stegodyphus dumicola]